MSHTVAQYHAAISAALRANDVQAVPSLLILMAREHPSEAQLLHEQIRLSLAVLTAEDPS